MVNKVLLAGKVADLKVTWDADGKPSTSFTLCYEQPYGEGRTSKLFVPIDVTPSRAESVAEQISDGSVVLIDGSLKWRSWVDRKTGEKQGKLAVLAWSVSVLQPAIVESQN
jgi:single-stranded DNA-binding protein